MNLSIYLLALCAYSIGITSADKAPDDLYIDDELEGSGGGHREFGKDDLEASGSGFGPDDEDGPSSSGDGDFPVDPFPPKEKEPSPPHPQEPPVQPDVRKTVEVTSGPEPPRHDVESPPKSEKPSPDHPDVLMDPGQHAPSFFAQPGILAAVIGGCVVGLLCAILVVMFIVYRMRKKDEGSYALEEPKRSPTANSYTKNSQREFYA